MSPETRQLVVCYRGGQLRITGRGVTRNTRHVKVMCSAGESWLGAAMRAAFIELGIEPMQDMQARILAQHAVVLYIPVPVLPSISVDTTLYNCTFRAYDTDATVPSHPFRASALDAHCVFVTHRTRAIGRRISTLLRDGLTAYHHIGGLDASATCAEIAEYITPPSTAEDVRLTVLGGHAPCCELRADDHVVAQHMHTQALISARPLAGGGAKLTSDASLPDAVYCQWPSNAIVEAAPLRGKPDRHIVAVTQRHRLYTSACDVYVETDKTSVLVQVCINVPKAVAAGVLVYKTAAGDYALSPNIPFGCYTVTARRKPEAQNGASVSNASGGTLSRTAGH